MTGEVVRRTINSKDVEYVVEPGGRGHRQVEVPDERRSAPCLDDEELSALVELGKRVERHFGGRQDVEWAIDREGTLHALQTRPVTVAPEAETPPAADSAIALVMNAFGAGKGRWR